MPLRARPCTLCVPALYGVSRDPTRPAPRSPPPLPNGVAQHVDGFDWKISSTFIGGFAFALVVEVVVRALRVSKSGGARHSIGHSHNHGGAGPLPVAPAPCDVEDSLVLGCHGHGHYEQVCAHGTVLGVRRRV